MVGGDFPGWLADLLGTALTLDLTDERGECIYSACRHFRRCFIERAIRKARRADIVVANHALVMVQATRADDPLPPSRFVFDEGHHLFEAADNAFSLQLTGQEMRELREWITGGDRPADSRRRGLRDRLADIAEADARFADALGEVALSGAGTSRARVAATARSGGAPKVRQKPFSSRCGSRCRPAPVTLSILSTASNAPSCRRSPACCRRQENCAPRSVGLIRPCGAWRSRSPTASTMKRRALIPPPVSASTESAAVSTGAHCNRCRVGGRCSAALADGAPPEFVDWLEITRSRGQEFDVGVHRHWIDPMMPFARVVLEPAHGVLITSATLRDERSDATRRVGDGTGGDGNAAPRQSSRYRAAIASPFDYARQTCVLVVGDVDRDNPRQVAAALRALFLAAGGGALGLFTAISRLRAVWRQLAGPLEDAGMRLLAQHMDALDTGTLVDIFRAEENACLLGTDALREGIDVPGRSLRLVVLDRVPWPRPTLLHRARREAFGMRAYDDRLTRLKLKQAYGRLVRRVDDRGAFVVLDRAMPSRLASAFPPGVTVARVGLGDAVAAISRVLRD